MCRAEEPPTFLLGGRYWEKEFPVKVDLDAAKNLASTLMWVDITDTRTSHDGEGTPTDVEKTSERVPVYLASLLIGQPAEVRSLQSSILTTVGVAAEDAPVLSSELLDALRPMVVRTSALKRLPPEVSEKLRVKMTFWGFPATPVSSNLEYPLQFAFFPGVYHTRHYWEACREATTAPTLQLLLGDQEEVIAGAALLSTLDLLRPDTGESAGLLG
ncbi:hypothetical protein FOZ63_011123, partial [Perkinsus olseni]